MKKISIVGLFIFAFFIFSFIGVTRTFAADYTINCNVSGCTPNTIAGFFPASEVWYPGKTYTKTLQISNTSGSTQKVMVEAVNTITTGNLDQVIQYTIAKEDMSTPWDNSLYEFYGNGETQILNSFANGASHTFTFTGYMYSTAGNEYQEKTTQHDLIIGYLYNPTPTPGICTATKPNTPGSTSVSRVNDTEVKLTWGDAGGTFTGYKITWSRDKDTDGDGDGTKFVGKTTEINIGGLELNKYGYYFKVRAINDCKEGEPNGIIFTGSGSDLRNTSPSPTPIGAVLGITTQGGNVLGAETDNVTPSPLPSLTPVITSTPNVLGATTVNNCNCIWWQILLGEFIVAAAYFFLIAKDKKQKRHKLVGIVGVIITFLVFRFLNPCLTFSYFIFANSPSLFCKYFIVADVLIVVTLMLFKKYRDGKDEGMMSSN